MHYIITNTVLMFYYICLYRLRDAHDVTPTFKTEALRLFSKADDIATKIQASVRSHRNDIATGGGNNSHKNDIATGSGTNSHRNDIATNGGNNSHRSVVDTGVDSKIATCRGDSYYHLITTSYIRLACN